MDTKEIKEYRIFRKRITAGDFDHHPNIKKDDTHLITVEVKIDGNKWATSPTPIRPADLKMMVSYMLDKISKEYSKHI